MSKLSALLALGLTLLLCACSSSSSSSGDEDDLGTPLRVTYIAYKSGQHLELVNEAHTGRLEQYSAVRSDAARKVQTNDVMRGLVEVLEKNGFKERAQEGAAPANAGVMVWALEIEDAQGLRHIGPVPGLSPEENHDLLRLAAAFVDTYNATYGLQAVELKDDSKFFQTPTSKSRK